MSIAMELLEAIHKFHEEHGEQPTTLKIREDIIIKMVREVEGHGQLLTADTTKKPSERYTHFDGIKFEVIENDKKFVVPDWEIGKIISGKYVYQKRINLPTVPEYKIGIINLDLDN